MTNLGLKTNQNYSDPDQVPRHIVEDIFERLLVNRITSFSAVEILTLKRLWRNFKDVPSFDIGRRVDSATMENIFKNLSKQRKNIHRYKKQYPNGEQI